MDKKIIEIEVSNYLNSGKIQQMQIGDKYYNAENDILKRSREVDGEEMEINNRIPHAFYRDLIDEKINYVLGKEVTIIDASSDVLEALGEDFNLLLEQLAFESSNKGCAWLHPHVNEEGILEFIVIPTEEIIPIWKDSREKELESVIRVYSKDVYTLAGDSYTVTPTIFVEYWDTNKVDFYVLDNNELVLDSTKYLDNRGQEIGHFNVDGTACGFGKVPFIRFKNNRTMRADIFFVKDMIDAYDLTRSDMANAIEENTELLYCVKGYDGNSTKGLAAKVKQKRVINTDTDGGVDVLNPALNFSAHEIHLERLKADIIQIGQGVMKDKDKLGTAMSGIALKMLYTSLDLKCSAMESSFRVAFREILKFIELYNNTNVEGVTLTFNRSGEMNVSENIKNCMDSLGLVSKETILANHPFVTDVVEELKRVEKEEEEALFIDEKQAGNGVLGEEEDQVHQGQDKK